MNFRFSQYVKRAFSVHWLYQSIPHQSDKDVSLFNVLKKILKNRFKFYFSEIVTFPMSENSISGNFHERKSVNCAEMKTCFFQHPDLYISFHWTWVFSSLKMGYFSFVQNILDIFIFFWRDKSLFIWKIRILPKNDSFMFPQMLLIKTRKIIYTHLVNYYLEGI